MFAFFISDVFADLSADGGNVVVMDLVMFDGHVLLNGSIVKNIISSIDEGDVSEMIGSVYYSGELYSESSNTQSVYVQLITSIAGGNSCILLFIRIIFFQGTQPLETNTLTDYILVKSVDNKAL